MKTCDLHVHSVFSDGTLTPLEILKEAKEKNLSAIALTDHNTVDGIDSFEKAFKGSGIETVAGVEFSTDYGQIELHILGLFIKKEYFLQVKQMTDELLKRKNESTKIMIERLKRDGIDVDFDSIKLVAKGTINRAHIGEMLLKKGYVSSISESFKTLLSKKGPYYHTPKRLDVFETIKFIKDVGATPVLAHPFLDLDLNGLTTFLPQAKKHGLVGMETVYTTYDDGTTLLAKKIAREFGIKESGGSDFHGYRKPDVQLGKGKGNLIIPYEFYENLRP